MIQEPTPLTPMPTGFEPSPAPRRPRSSAPWLVAVVIALFVGAVSFAWVLAASPTSPTAAAAGATAAATPAAPTATKDPDGDKSGKGRGFGWANGLSKIGKFGFGQDFGKGKGAVRGPITIKSINGSDLHLGTDDGWTRTITVTADTKITKGGQTIAVGALKVGDEVRLNQTRNADGTYTITAIVVPTPKTGGEVTAVSGNQITIKKRDGSAQVVTVNGSTVYTLGKAAGSKADVTVGVDIAAEGTLVGTDFTALSVHVALANVGGEVTAKSSNTITVKGRDGTETVIHVSSTTTFKVRGADPATIADIAVGDFVGADGVLRANGSLDAVGVFGIGPKGDWGKPKPSPTTNTTPG